MPHVCSSDRALRMQPEAAVDDRAQAPKERPILFSGAMVRALLAGTKTQTRRVVKGAPEDWAPVGPEVFSPTVIDRHGDEQPGPDSYGAGNEDGDCWIRCPYGAPGDRLWVRESWMPDPPIDDTWASTQWAGCREGKIAGVPERFRHPRFCNYAADWLHGPVIWTPSIHMPRWASRITLEITDVRVERLQDISEEDAEAEGVDEWARRACGDPDALWPSDKFELLWCGINGRDSWQANPWVWVLSFRKTASGCSHTARPDGAKE